MTKKTAPEAPERQKTDAYGNPIVERIPYNINDERMHQRPTEMIGADVVNGYDHRIAIAPTRAQHDVLVESMIRQGGFQPMPDNKDVKPRGVRPVVPGETMTVMYRPPEIAAKMLRAQQDAVQKNLEGMCLTTNDGVPDVASKQMRVRGEMQRNERLQNAPDPGSHPNGRGNSGAWSVGVDLEGGPAYD